MVFGRVYPTPDGNSHREALQRDLFTRLRKMGYTSHEEGGSFEGAKLLRIEEDGSVLCPYIDGGYMITDTGEHLVMGDNGEYDADRTDGYLYEPGDYWYCEACDGRRDEYHERYTVCDSWTPAYGVRGHT